MTLRVIVLTVMTVAALGVAPAGAQSPDYRAPRGPDGRPDLNGIWQALNTAHWDIEPHPAGPSVVQELGTLSAVPGGLGVVLGDEIPYRPEALAVRNENRTHLLERDPVIKCYLPGVPRGMYMPFPVQIIQSQQHIMIVHEYAGAVRTIYMDDQVDAPADSWMGWSNGPSGETVARALAMVEELTQDAEIGRVYLGKVKRIADFGAFAEIFPGTDGLIHISHLAEGRVENVTDILSEGDEVLVKCIDIDPAGRIRLSRKEALADAAQGADAGGSA